LIQLYLYEVTSTLDTSYINVKFGKGSGHRDQYTSTLTTQSILLTTFNI